MSQARTNSSKHVSGKPLSTLLQELITSSTKGCLSTCEAVRALRRLAPPILKDTPTIRLRKKITDCLTRNPAFDVAHDYLRHGIRPRYALRNTDVAAGGHRFAQKNVQKLPNMTNGSYAQSIKTGDRLLQEAVEGTPSVNIKMKISKSRSLQKDITEKEAPKPTRGNSVIHTSPPANYHHPAYAYFPETPRFPKINFPDLTYTHVDVITPPKSSSPYYTSNLNHLSPMQGNMFHPSPAIFSDLNPIHYNQFPFLTPPTSPKNTMSFLPHISSDEVIECLTLV